MKSGRSVFVSSRRWTFSALSAKCAARILANRLGRSRRTKEGIYHERAHQGCHLGAVKDHTHPRVILALAETVERLAEGEIPDDVEGGIVVPAGHVESVSARGYFVVQSLH